MYKLTRKYYTQNYFEKNFESCNECGTYNRSIDLTDTINGTVCQECLENLYFYCSDCENYVHDSNVVTCDWCGEVVCRSCGWLVDETWLCHNCYGNSYSCSDCGCLLDESSFYTYNGYIYCEYCYDRNNKDIINCYSYKPDPIFYHNKNEKYFFGVELEVDYGNNKRETAKSIINNCEEIYCKDDSSLSSGFEIVSHPCSLEYHENNLNWEEILKIVKNNGYKSHDTDTCGIHVHISREAFGKNNFEQDANIAKLLYLFEKFWPEVKKFSRRKDIQINRYAKRYGLKTPLELLDEAKNSDRYFAINLENYNTIEIRIFRGTLKYTSFIACLQFCQVMVRVVNKYSLKSIQKFTWNKFVDNSKKYKELTNYIIDRGLKNNKECDKNVYNCI